ncbi:MAG: methyltransferase domain-containing protein [Tepidanaerobacteraceae bacterium]|jgi:23S rRNA (guanine745-N1)-methyltransferase|nr:methyltransferase domain-containing protein [Tepidanaerobacteraceae bacterium]
MKKIDIAKTMFSDNCHLFKCPVCGNEMNIADSQSLVCINRHSFDLSRQGYVNLLLKANKSKYDKDMLESRNIISKSGFFDPMLEQISSLVLRQISPNPSSSAFVLDAGCGEGSHLSRILSMTRNKSRAKLQAVGIDISKEGIRIAARDNIEIIWCVADLAKLPFKDKQFDVILNVLSPASYTEFDRVLKDTGILIKVVPESGYLIQLRNIFFDRTDKEAYSNEKVIKLFTENFHLIENQRLSYEVELDETSLYHLLNMTPLTWNVDKEKMQKVNNMRISRITADFRILCGNKF